MRVIRHGGRRTSHAQEARQHRNGKGVILDRTLLDVLGVPEGATEIEVKSRTAGSSSRSSSTPRRSVGSGNHEADARGVRRDVQEGEGLLITFSAGLVRGGTEAPLRSAPPSPCPSSPHRRPGNPERALTGAAGNRFRRAATPPSPPAVAVEVPPGLRNLPSRASCTARRPLRRKKTTGAPTMNSASARDLKASKPQNLSSRSGSWALPA